MIAGSDTVCPRGARGARSGCKQIQTDERRGGSGRRRLAQGARVIYCSNDARIHGEATPFPRLAAQPAVLAAQRLARPTTSARPLPRHCGGCVSPHTPKPPPCCLLHCTVPIRRAVRVGPPQPPPARSAAHHAHSRLPPRNRASCAAQPMTSLHAARPSRRLQGFEYSAAGFGWSGTLSSPAVAAFGLSAAVARKRRRHATSVRPCPAPLPSF